MKQDILDASLNLFQYTLYAVATSEDLKIISLCLSIASTLIILIPKLWKILKSFYNKVKAWHKKAIEDKHIDKEEIKELANITKDTADEIVEVVEELHKEGED